MKRNAVFLGMRDPGHLILRRVHALHAGGKNCGLHTMCAGGGIANVTIP